MKRAHATSLTQAQLEINRLRNERDEWKSRANNRLEDNLGNALKQNQEMFVDDEDAGAPQTFSFFLFVFQKERLVLPE